MSQSATQLAVRPPVIAVMGHIDHGKSTLLDYIRKTKVTETEAGGITQHLSAYEVEHPSQDGSSKKITFLDTPGHEAFQKMRARGSKAADIAILVVSAEDGVKPQTLEALKAITDSNIPYVVAINKIDTPAANVEQTKANLLESGIYLEGLGGEIPYVPISAKTGEGVPDLLDMLLLVADMQELKADHSASATGVVIEAHRDSKRGITATLIIRNGTLASGGCVVAGGAFAPLRMIEDFMGNTVKSATFSSPVSVIGFNKLPEVGSEFVIVANKKEAEKVSVSNTERSATMIGDSDAARVTIPVIVKADAAGSIEAIEHELHKLEDERFALNILSTGVGAVSENDIMLASGTSNALVIGFHVSVDGAARDLAERFSVAVATFDIIYELAKWLEEAVETRTPKQKERDRVGLAKVLKIFNATKEKQVVGCRMLEGSIKLKAKVSIYRRGERLGDGVVDTLQQSKAAVDEVAEGLEFGTQITSRVMIGEGDEIESFVIVER